MMKRTMMKRTLTTFTALALSCGAVVATLSEISPAMAQTSCRWDNGQLRCDDNNSNRDDDDDRDDRYNNDRYNNDRYNNDRYNQDRYNNQYNNRGNRQNVEEQIDRLYREVLGRPADSSGLRTYRDRVNNNNWSMQRVRDELANSREAESAINRAYQEILGREADSRGRRTYLQRLRSGWSIQRVREDLMNSRDRR